MNNNAFLNLQMPQQENEEPDNTDSGSYPSVFDLHFSNARRRLGRRNRSTSTLKPKEEKPESSLFSLKSSDNQTHPINPGAGSSAFPKPFSTSSTLKSKLQLPQSVDKISYNNANYKNIELCKKNLNYGTSTPEKQPTCLQTNFVSICKNYPFPVLSSHDKENVLPVNDRLKEAAQMKSLFGSNKAFDQIDAPLKLHIAVPNTDGSNGLNSNTVLEENSQNQVKNILKVVKEENVFKAPSVPDKPLDLSPREKTDPDDSDLSQDFQTAVMSTSKFQSESPLDLSSHNTSKTMISSTLVDLPQCLDSLNLHPIPILPQHEPPSGMKSTDTPMSYQHQVPHHSLKETHAHTPVKPTIEPISEGQSKNESTPVFKKPMRVNSYKSVSQEQSQKSATELVAKSNVVPSDSILKKPQVEASKDVISLNNKQYKVLGPLGKGGSSSVYFVQETEGSELKPLLALKVVNLSSITDSTTADGYLKEVHYLKKLQGCPCVIKMYDYEYDTVSKHLYVVMEKGDSDLSKYLRNINKITTSHNIMVRIIQHWHEMLLAVKAIHAEGIIHSDLKPANFLFVGGVLKIIDFGIASSLQGDQTSVYKETASGTLNYMSPESVQDVSRVSYKSDVWSLGCILYNMIYGKTPYSHIPSQWAKMKAIADPKTDVQFNPHGNNTSVPPVLLDSMKLCLHKDLKARPTVEQLLQIVQNWYEIGLYVQVPLVKCQKTF